MGPVDDDSLIESFLEGARGGGSPTLHIEGDVLFLAGWWHAAVRLNPMAFLVRNEPPRQESRIREALASALGRRGLVQVADDHPLVQPITYAELSLAGVPWAVWAPDAEAGLRALVGRVGAESLPRDLAPEDIGVVGDFAPEMEGARRIAGLPPSVLLMIGLDPDEVRAFQAAVPEFRTESRTLDDMDPDACGDLRPSVVLVDAREERGRTFVMRLRASACSRFLAVAALTEDPEPPLGADLAIDPGAPRGVWRDLLLQFL